MKKPSKIELPPIIADFKEGEYQGIFYKVNEIAKILPSETHFFNVITSDQICSFFPKVIDPKWNQHYFSFLPNPFFQINFIESTITLHAYSIKTYAGVQNYAHLKSWILKGTIDGQTWFDLDSQNNCSDLNNYKQEHAWIITQNNDKPLVSIRLELTGPNWAGSDILVLNHIELYGLFQPIVS